ncbi:MAG: hypothetical protein K0S04_1149 [Herbinix sp.]|jgi:hypothetical protein|nr:hypothetical protein [Herbinix sp.]
MTEDEARAKQQEEAERQEAERQEAERLLREIDHLESKISAAISQKYQLKEELERLIQEILILTQSAGAMDNEVNQVMQYVTNKVKDTDGSISELFTLIDELTESYFTFKNLSTASKNVSQYTDEYYTKFSFYNELRRIALGYVVGLDTYVCSDETMRKKVEKAYLQNTDYWLAYAIMAVMLWASDEEEAANRAVSKSLSNDYLSTSLFFLLINLRFGRIQAAKKWYLTYLERVDINNLGSEWQYLLQTYLYGAFGADHEFQALVKESFTDMLKMMESMLPNYGLRVISRTKEYAGLYLHRTSHEYENLRRYSSDYEEMKKLLSDAEKNEILAISFKRIFESRAENGASLYQRIEDILYSLINSYEKEEYKVIKNLKYNEIVIRAKGNLQSAERYFNATVKRERDNKTSIDNLLFEWAFSEDEQTDIKVKKFAISYLKKWICSGFEKFAEDYRAREREKYTIEIDGWKEECDENSYEASKASLEKHYNKNRVKDTLSDMFVLLFLGMCVIALIILIVLMFFFSRIALVVGILLGIAGGFLLWRRIVGMREILQAKRENGIKVLKKALVEIKQWREEYRIADKKVEDLVQVFTDIN